MVVFLMVVVVVMLLNNGREQKVTEGGFVNFSLGVSFETRNFSLPQAPTAAFENAQFRKGVNDFITKIYGQQSLPPKVVVAGDNIVAPKGYQLAYLNAYGRGVIVLVPNTITLAFKLSSAKCTCSDGNCSPEDILFGVTCRGACKGTCCLNAITSSGATVLLQSYRL